MKNYTITVNGTVYDVTVEEGTAPAAEPVSMPKAAPKAAPKATTPAGDEGSIKVNAPMQGKILSVSTSVGKSVKKGEVLMVLEAMKMENEVVAPEDGTVATVNVSAGDSIEVGAVLATLN